MKRTLLIITAIALMRLGYAAIQSGQHQVKEPYPGQLIYQSPHEEPIYPDRPPQNHDTQSPPIKAPQYHPPQQATPHSSPSSFRLGTQGTHWGIVYSPYTSDSLCATTLSIRSDVASIARKGFKTLRLHSPDCNALPKVGSAARLHNLRLILGIHVDESGDPELVAQQIDELIAWSEEDSSNWSLIALVVLGEELLTSHTMSPARLADLLSSVRSTLRKAGYTGPITTTESLAALQKHAETLCSVIDVPASNIHPFFHPSVPPSLAGTYVSSALKELDNLCEQHVKQGIKGVNLETGWPRAGKANGFAVPGTMEQMDAIEGIMGEKGDGGGRSVFIGWGDDVWKEAGDLGVENAWGCGDLFSSLEEVVAGDGRFREEEGEGLRDEV